MAGVWRPGHYDQLLLPVLLGCCTAPGAASPWPGARSVLRRGLCGAAGAGAVRQCRPGGQQLPRPQTFQPMRWACQPSQSSTPASSPCGISVSPLRRVLLKKLLRSDDPAGSCRRAACSRLAEPAPTGASEAWAYGQLLLPVLLGCCTAPGAASPWPGARSAVLRRGLCGAAGAGAVRQCRPGGQQLPRPQTFQPMRWACQPSQSSTPASSPCGISVSPLRRFLLKKLLRSDDALIPGCCRHAALAGQRSQLGVWAWACGQLLLPVLLGCCTAPGAASPWPGARSCVLRRGLCGAAGAGAVRQCRPGGQQLPRPQTFQPMRWACQPSQSSTPASSPCGISVSPLRRVLLKKLLRSDDT